MLDGKRIVLGVTGGVAAYKAISLASMLTKAGAIVETVLTDNALQFVTPMSFSSVTGNPVYTDCFTKINDEIAHIYLGRADAILIVPASKNEIAKLAAGICDNLLLNAVSAAKCPIVLAPAMNTNMYYNPINIKNMEYLLNIGYKFIEPIEGRLACGDIGKGKLKEASEIFDEFSHILEAKSVAQSRFDGKRVIVTGGPTISKLDPVRIFTNRSSGKMANKLSEELLVRGANITFISHFKPDFHLKDEDRYVKVDTTQDMLEAVKFNIDSADYLFMAAAPLDYEFKEYFENKIKKSEELQFTLERTPDILLSIKDLPHKAKVIGFAAESENFIDNGMDKLNRKGMDAIFINDISGDKAMGSDFNEGVILSKDNVSQKIPFTDKKTVAKLILDFVEDSI